MTPDDDTSAQWPGGGLPPSTDPTVRLLVDLAAELAGTPTAWAVLVSARKASTLAVAGPGERVGLAERSLADLVIARGATVLIEDLRREPTAPAGPEAGDAHVPWRAFAGVPLRAPQAGVVVGVLAVADRRPRGFPPNLGPVLERIADGVVGVLARQRDEEVRAAADRARLETILATAIDPLASFRPIRDDDGTLVDVVPVEANLAHTHTGATPTGTPLLLRERDPELLAMYARVLHSGVAESLSRSYVAPRPDGGAGFAGWFDVRAARAGGDLVVSWRDVTEQVHAEERLRELALHDALTGLPNRALFQERLGEELAALARDRTRLALMFIDLDGFKAVNDRHGHAAGDRVLVEVARRLRTHLRPHDVVSRFAGDEFAVLCPDVDGPDGALTIAHRLLEAVDVPVVVADDGTAAVRASIGISLTDDPDADPHLLLDHADSAMYAAKDVGHHAEVWSPQGRR